MGERVANDPATVRMEASEHRRSAQPQGREQPEKDPDSQ